jgi:rhodanese-related sulfurtransferase
MWQKREIVPVVLVLVLLSWAFIGRATAQIEIPRITVEELKGMIDQGEGVLILDTQPKVIFDKGHIKGALSFPYKTRITAGDTARLPRDRLIVTYCDCGPGESDSAAMAAQLAELGFINVKVLADPSIRGWKRAGYPME